MLRKEKKRKTSGVLARGIFNILQEQFGKQQKANIYQHNLLY
jgi:hypothetical protein